MSAKEFCEWFNNLLNQRCPVGNYRGLNPLDIENIRVELNKTLSTEYKNEVSRLSE